MITSKTVLNIVLKFSQIQFVKLGGADFIYLG